MHFILIFIHFSWPHSDFQVVVFRVLHRNTDTTSWDPGHDVRQSRRGGSASATVRATVAWQPSVQPSACRRVDRGCPGRTALQCTMINDIIRIFFFFNHGLHGFHGLSSTPLFVRLERFVFVKELSVSSV